MHVNIIALPHIISILTYQAGDKGERKKLEIIMISSASHKWKNIASLICDDTMELMISVLDKIYPGDPEKCLRQIFINHFNNGKPLNYSQDWKGLMELERINAWRERLEGRGEGGDQEQFVQTCEKVNT